MKCHLALLALLFFVLPGYSQTIDTLKKQSDTSTRDTTPNSPILSKVVIYDKSAKPQFQRDTLILEKAENKSNGNSEKKSSPVSRSASASASLISSAIDAGRTTGLLDASATGGANYTIPISIPPGLGKNIPQIALSYNSQAGKGIAGLGWNIAGLSSITRISTSMFHDGRIDGVNLNENDRFALDGQRLILKSGTYGANGAEYQTENYSNIRVISHGSIQMGNSYGPEYFEVLYPDGSKAFYGNDSNSRNQIQWAINYSESPIGARISYDYILSNNSIFIDNISYGGIATPNGSTLNYINFIYAYSSKPEQGYVAGVSIFNDRILNKISVSGSGDYVRHYKLNYENISTLNHQRLTSVQEFNGDEQRAFAPINFSYSSTNDVVVSNMISNLSMSGIASNNSDVLTADFTGNGSMDFLLYNKGSKDKFYAFYDMEPNSSYYQMGYEVNTGAFLDIYSVTALTWNNKISAGQGMALVKENGVGSYKFDVYSSGTVAPVYYQYDRIWDNVPMGPEFYSNCDNTTKQNPLNYQFLSGDFNGDGLTDIVAINDANVVTYENPQASDDPQYNPGNCDQGMSDVGSTVHFINLDRRLTSGFVTNVGMLSISFQYGEKLLTGDYNGDGRTDILHIKQGAMYVYSINQNNQLVLLWQTADSRIKNTELALLGDYNGDGKTDIMFSTGYNSTFATFVSTATSFGKVEQNQPFSNTAGTWNGTLSLHYLIPNDVDGDGKTDIISASTATKNNSTNGSTSINVYYSGSPTSFGQPNFYYGAGKNTSIPLIHYPIPLFLNPTKPNTKLELGFISNNSISLFRFNRDFRSESQLTNINHDGVVHTVEYRSIDSDQIYNNDVQLYSISYDQTYPYVDLQTIPGLIVVSKINRYYGAEQVSQVFGYGKAVSHAGGLGFLGFSELIRSNWHVDNNDVNRIFNISIFDPQLRGAQIKSFTSKSTYINPAFKSKLTLPSDTTLSNSITAAQTVEASNSITLLPGFVANGNNGVFLAKIHDASAEINDGATINDYITRTEHTYSQKLLSDKVWINVPIVTANKDMLLGTFNTQAVTYDAYYNPAKTISNINEQGSKVVEVTYENNPAGNYIGRPLSSKTTLNNGSDTYTSQEEFTYSGFLPVQVRKKGHGTDWVTENMTYDAFGNVTQKTTTVPGGAQRTVSMAYDGSGRFVTSATDAEGMISTAEYDQSTGNKKKSTNPFNRTESYVYDTWGRLITTTDYLGVNENRSYQTDGYNIVVTNTDDEGHASISITNPLGQTIETKSKNILGQYIGQATQFDVYGREIASSEATQAGNYTQWNTTAYDEYGRIKQTTNFTGKVTGISYNGLSSTVNDGNKSITTAKNAFGQVASLQDPGGTISYSYFANGNMKTADYGGMAQTIEQDGWGRKTKLTDPSAGIYQYEYDGWGQLIKETNPKGYTQYTYEASGRVSQKKIIGDETNMQYGYTYDNATKLLTSMALTNADGNSANYTYNYDANKRIQSTVEDNLHARFVKSYTYDSYGRISGEYYEAKDKQSNISISKGIDLQYQNGELLQTSLQGTGQIIWKVNNLNNKGQISDASQGSALKNTFQYDAYGLPQQSTLQNVSASPVTLMSLGYNFDAQRGLLNSRTNSAFDWNESFGYDNLDRLTSFNDNISNNSQSYDNRGRIQNNSQLGDYSYDGASYKQTELDLSNNETAKAYYQQDHALQQVNYNAFKSPVEIIEQGKERISFQYNGSLGRSHMYYGDEQADKLNRRFRRHYSEDGGMEITNDLQTGKNSFVFYLSGDAYSAPAIWKEVHQAGQSSQTTQNLYYLHRDHLGSIVMITNDQGGIVEKRQFDAWGNIVKIQDGNGNDLAAFVILDRGYTGHEHLLGVGLIHMNGRLYDPKLHRFLSPDNFVQDQYFTQNYNRYGYAMNNPLMYTDASGEFLHILVGAIIGGAINLTIKIVQGKIHNVKDGLFAFGIGAVAGGAAAATGGAALAMTGLTGTSIIGGAVAGLAGSTIASPIQGFGNKLYFGDPYSFKSFGKDLLFGAVGGAVVGGTTALFKGNNIWWGNAVAEGRNQFSFNNSAISNPTYSTNIGGVEADEIQRIIETDDISELLQNNNIQARTGNPIYKGVVDDYLKQMNNGTLDLRHGAAGYTKGNLFLIDDGHHKVIAAAIRGMQTGDFSYLQRMIGNGNFRPWTPSNNLPFGKFPTKWKP